MASLLFLGASAAIFSAACDDGVGEGVGYAAEADYCRECQKILFDCTSTSKDMSQFVQCRDLWQTCQSERGLTAEQCGRPNDQTTCFLCQQGETTCREGGAEAAECGGQFDSCKSFLIRRPDLANQCTLENLPPSKPDASACDSCQSTFAACASEVGLENAKDVCTERFVECAKTQKLASESCSPPSGQKACDLCKARHDDCAAQEGQGCTEAFKQCGGAIASAVTCEVSGGAGGAGGTGGAGGGGTGSCEQDVCKQGLPQDKTCNTCTEKVCTIDEYCCTTEWDLSCVGHAEKQTECGCGT